MKVIENVTNRYTAYDFRLMFHSNYGSILSHFWDIQCRKISRPWNRGQEPIKVIESSDVNKDWTRKDKDKDQAYKDQDKDKD